MISVVIPAFNADRTLVEQIEALSAQTYQGEWEVVIADNGSTDGTIESLRDLMRERSWLRLVDASERTGAACARNLGARAASGEYLAFCDADDVVSAKWLEALVEALTNHDFVCGAIDHDTLNPGRIANWHFRSHVTSAPNALRFMPYALSANMAVSRRAFESVGGFPEDMGPIGEDVALSWSLQLAGYPLHFEPNAVAAYRHRSDLKSLWRQHFGYGRADPVIYRRFQQHGVPPRSLLSSGWALVRLIWRLPDLLSNENRHNWVRNAAKLTGRLVGSLQQRVLYI